MQRCYDKTCLLEHLFTLAEVEVVEKVVGLGKEEVVMDDEQAF